MIFELQKKLNESGWMPHVSDFFESSHWKRIVEETWNHERCPRNHSPFRALFETRFSEVKCVIVGKEPYCTPDTANGLAFAVEPGKMRTPTLHNIFKELDRDQKTFINHHANSLLGWTKQGVLLLNTILTVREGFPESHKGIGWEEFTKTVLASIAKHNSNTVFVLWGSEAKDIFNTLPNKFKLLRLEAPHPAPETVNDGFFSCGHFSKVNELLSKRGIKPIDWSIVDMDDGEIYLPTMNAKDEYYEQRHEYRNPEFSIKGSKG